MTPTRPPARPTKGARCRRPAQWTVWLAAVLLAVLAAALQVQAQENPPGDGSASEPDRLEEKRRELEEMRAKERALKDLQDKERALEETRRREQAVAQDVAALAEERARLNERLIDTARRIQAGEARLSQIEDRIGELSVHEHDVRQSIQQRHDAIGKLLASLQRLGAEPPPALVTRRDDALAMVRSAMMMATLYPELKLQAEILARDLGDLVRLQEELAHEGERLRDEQAALDAERRRIDGLLAEKRALHEAREGDLAGIRKAAEENAKAVTYLNDLVQRMDKEIAARMAEYEAELAAEAEAAKKAQAEAQRVAFVSPGRIKPAVPFDSTKGVLPRPALGTPVRHFGGPDGYGGTSKGAAIETREGAQVISPADGWVVYADEFRGYGQLLIINAGGGYHILLAGMRRIDVSLGQFVLAGEPVAVMGEASKAGGGTREGRPVLYVEFRKDGQPIDPDPWWSEVPEKVQG